MEFVEGGSFSAELIVLVSLGSMQEVADIAEWEDEQIEYIEDKVSEEGKQEDLKKGKEPAQVLERLIHCCPSKFLYFSVFSVWEKLRFIPKIFTEEQGDTQEVSRWALD